MSGFPINVGNGGFSPQEPFRAAVQHLVNKNAASMFVSDVLDLWVKGQAHAHGWKTGGKSCQREIVSPVLDWWVNPNGRLEDVVKQKYHRPALALAAKIDEVAWVLFGDERANRCLCEQTD